MGWTPGDIKEGSDFRKSLKNTGLRKNEESLLVESVRLWLRGEHDLLKGTVSNKMLDQKDGKYVFVIRVPNPARGQGKSGGFRLIMLYDTEQNFAEIGKIFKRTDLTYRGNTGKRQEEFDEYVQAMKERIK